MDNLSHILLASDGSEHALKAARFAGMLARQCGAKITPITVHNEEVILPSYLGPAVYPAAAPYASLNVDEIRKTVEENAENFIFKETVKACGDGVKVEAPEQLWGHVVETICAYADDHDVDMIVIGTRGHSAFKKLLLGSISSQVASHAHCPVTLVR